MPEMTMSEGNPFNSESARKPSVVFNPFYYVAGGPALGIGLLVILATGLIGSFSHTHFDGVLDMHSGRVAPLWFHLVQGFINWLALAVPLYIAGLILSRSRGVRALDVFGTQALARTPTLISALLTLLPGYQSTNSFMTENATKLADPNQVAAFAEALKRQPGFPVFLIVVICSVVMIIWMAMLMYRAYAHSCNIKGTRAIVSFIALLILAEVISMLAIFGLMRGSTAA